MAEVHANNIREERQLPEYYRSLDNWNIPHKIKDFDHSPTHDEFNRYVVSPKSRNFIIDFNDDEAWCGFNLDAEAYDALLNAPRPLELNTRWINIWLPHDQKETLTALARHYEFTPRLLGFMCTPPVRQTRSLQSSKTSSFSSLFQRSKNEHDPSSRKSSPQASRMDDCVDSEEKVGMETWSNASSLPTLSETFNPYFLASEIWHYSSVDWGRRYVCLGFNVIHNVPASRNGTAFDDDEEHLDRPHGRRIWTWLLLCEDKTVITIHEDPYPFRNGNLSSHEKDALIIIRRNLINTFRQCSKARHGPHEPSQLKLPLRTRLGETEEETMHRPTDTPGLLFYYLFDDWFNTYNLIAGREHRYRTELSHLRKCMLSKAELGHVDRLHHIGRKLATLKRIYEGYESLIDRVLDKQEATLASLKNSHVLPSHQGSPVLSSMSSSTHQHINETELMGVSISSASRVRFQRLRHRIRLYALSEIQECIDQKESLVMMNFNLIAIKESYSVERLTRITLLLAKVTLIFMPVSLMTAYFSCQLKDVEFTLKSYWAWFAAIFGASIVGVVAFSFVSGTLEGSMIYKPMSKRLVDLTTTVYKSKRRSTSSVEDL